jgi:hypothetical protein
VSENEDRLAIIHRNARDAYLLLEFLARNGVTVDFNVAKTIMQGMDLRPKGMPSFDEVAFWAAVSSLASKASPTHIESLKILAPLTRLDQRPAVRWLQKLGDIRVFVLRHTYCTTAPHHRSGFRQRFDPSTSHRAGAY